MVRAHSSAFRGRFAERELLDRLLANVRGGQSGVLVVRGEAGVGKTALLRHAAEQATDFRVVQLAGVESEMELPFAGLHQLCAPLLERLDALPDPQQRALRVAFGLAPGAAPDRFLVALGALTLLAEVAEEKPLLCLADDAQWLDDASAQVLGFVGRRVLAESVAMVFAVREGHELLPLAGLPEWQLGGLDEQDSREVLATVIPGRLDERVRDRIVAETRGNPLALLELPRGLSAAQLAGGFGLPDVAPLAGRIEESFLRQLEPLPATSRLLLLLAAAEPIGDPALLWRAASRLDIGTVALEPAYRAGLLEVGARVRFRHPLVRSAVYRSASDWERQSVHRALAEATDPVREPDRRAWHRAQATEGLDEEVAVELVRSAARAQARGGLAAAASFLSRAASLTGDRRLRAARTLAAAQVHLQAGAFEDALMFLAAAEAGPLDELAQARVGLLRAQLAYARNRGRDAAQLLLQAATALEPLDPALARETYLDAWSAALFAGSLARSGNMREVAQAVRDAPAPPRPRRASDVLLEGLALLSTDGTGAAAPALAEAAAVFAGRETPVDEVLRWGWLATAAAAIVWDIEACLAVGSRAVDLAREAGALEVLTVALNVTSQVIALSGDFAKAGLLIAEAHSVREVTGTVVAPYGALVLAAYRGQPDALGLVEETIREATAGGEGNAVQYAYWARAVIGNARGDYGDALVAATKASEDRPTLIASAWALAELVEAGVRAGRTEAAAEALARLAHDTHASTTGWARGVEARSRALLSDDASAEPLYREAIGHLEGCGMVPDAARAQLLYGEWLRRQERRVDAREQLRAAYESFVAMGAAAFAERARRELAATGEKVRQRRADTRDELTAQEEQIARLARDGLTNPEIGAQLFISPRTVEWHLRKVFTKLGISSRRGLHDALPDRGPG